MNKNQKLIIDTIKDLFEKDESLEFTDLICKALKEQIYNIEAEDHHGVKHSCFPMYYTDIRQINMYDIRMITNKYFVKLLRGLPKKSKEKVISKHN